MKLFWLNRVGESYQPRPTAPCLSSEESHRNRMTGELTSEAGEGGEPVGAAVAVGLVLSHTDKVSRLMCSNVQELPQCPKATVRA